ncbi:hypothetical protein LDENG_00237630, partial [Lucifuga dentata]
MIVRNVTCMKIEKWAVWSFKGGRKLFIRHTLCIAIKFESSRTCCAPLFFSSGLKFYNFAWQSWMSVDTHTHTQ